MNIDTLKEILPECYSKDLCYSKYQEKWSEDNIYFGMCAITSLLVNDYYGGKICKMHVDGISHHFNLVENQIIDLTANQFHQKLNYDNYELIDINSTMTTETIEKI